MQRIAVLLLCTGLWAAETNAQSCEAVGTVVGGFVGGATGYGLVATLGAASNWVAAGLYGAGIAVGSQVGRSAGESGCDHFAENFKRIGEMYCRYSGFYYDCDPVQSVAESLYADFVICPSCSWDEVFGAFLMEDSVRENFLRQMQIGKMGHLSAVVDVIPRNHIGALSPAILNSYFVGLQAGFSTLTTTTRYTSLK